MESSKNLIFRVEMNESNKIFFFFLDFGINSLSEFYAKEHLEEIKSSEKTLQTSQLNDKNININDMDRNREQEKQECELTNSSYSANEPLSYGPPSGSSQTSLRPSLEFPSRKLIFEFSLRFVALQTITKAHFFVFYSDSRTK